jgi:hypothetical protein
MGYIYDYTDYLAIPFAGNSTRAYPSPITFEHRADVG